MLDVKKPPIDLNPKLDRHIRGSICLTSTCAMRYRLPESNGSPTAFGAFEDLEKITSAISVTI
ncbi:hypothetical protein J28TS4_40750 [Paenibacillus lautus]|nr:hypothetical protein J28TS4_40750 [Paenibacillus lautus]